MLVVKVEEYLLQKILQEILNRKRENIFILGLYIRYFRTDNFVVQVYINRVCINYDCQKNEISFLLAIFSRWL